MSKATNNKRKTPTKSEEVSDKPKTSLEEFLEKQNLALLAEVQSQVKDTATLAELKSIFRTSDENYFAIDTKYKTLSGFQTEPLVYRNGILDAAVNNLTIESPQQKEAILSLKLEDDSEYGTEGYVNSNDDHLFEFFFKRGKKEERSMITNEIFNTLLRKRSKADIKRKYCSEKLQDMDVTMVVRETEPWGKKAKIIDEDTY